MLSLINSSFNNRPKGKQQFESVCKSLNVQRFFRFRPAAGKTLEQDPQCLDLARFRDSKLKLPQFRTLVSMMSDVDAWTRQEMPIAIMGYKNKEEEQQAIAKGLHERNASMRCGYSFLGGMTFPKLLQAYSMLDPKYMWMCAMVMDDAPVHLYFDFDASVSANAERQHSATQLLAQRVQGQEDQVKQEFCTTFDRFFQHTYGRAVDWSGLHWETASNEQGGKFSLHAHVTTEAFVNIQHMRRFMEAYVAYIDREAAAGNIRWMQHATATLLDGAVYTPNRVFRLVGCRKLHKTELCPMPSTEAESLLSLAELVFRGMPSLSIDVDDGKLLSFAQTQHVQQRLKRKRTHDDHAPSMRKADGIASSETPSDRIAALQRMFINLRVLGPNVAIGKCQTILTQSGDPATDRVISRIQGEFVLRSAWCPNRTKYDSGEPHVHENTPMAFCVTLRGVTISDFCCGTNKKQHFVPATMDHAWSALFGNGPDPSISTPPEVGSLTQGLSQTDPDTPCSMSSSEQSDVIIIDTLETEPASIDGPGLVVVVDRNRPQSPMESAAEPGEPQLNQAETCTAPQEIDLQPSLASIERIVQEQISTQQSSFDELKMQMQIGAVRRDPHVMATCENSAIAMDAAVELAVVSYLNQFWARFLRLGKPWMVQELGSYSRELGRIRWQPSFNSLKDLKEIYSNLNIQLPNYAGVLVQLQPGRAGGRAGKSRHITVNAASLWLDHPAGRRLNRIEFNPQKPATLFRELPSTGDIGDYNLWRGFDITQEMADAYQSNLELTGVTRTCADLAAPLLNHILHVWCRNSKVLYDYAISWMANMIQKCGKNGTALVVKGPQGAGKGIVVQKLADIIGRSADHFFHAHNLEDVLGTYTHNLRSSCLAFLDEVTYGGNHEQAQRLKKLVTEPTHIINAKYQPSYTVDSYLNIIIASNDAFVVPCETRQRRFMALEVDEGRCGRQTKELKQYYDEIMAVPALAFAHVLYHHDLSNYNPREIHATDFERDQKVRSFGPMMAWWHDCLQEQHIEGATTMMVAQAESGDTATPGPFGAIVVKDSMYDSFTSFCTRNRRGSTYQITAKNEFWKLLDAWTQTNDRAQRQVRLAHPELKRQVLDANGLKVWARVVLVPSIDECRSAWKDRVVFDSEWVFASV